MARTGRGDQRSERLDNPAALASDATNVIRRHGEDEEYGAASGLADVHGDLRRRRHEPGDERGEPRSELGQDVGAHGLWLSRQSLHSVLTHLRIATAAAAATSCSIAKRRAGFSRGSTSSATASIAAVSPTSAMARSTTAAIVGGQPTRDRVARISTPPR